MLKKNGLLQYNIKRNLYKQLKIYKLKQYRNVKKKVKKDRKLAIIRQLATSCLNNNTIKLYYNY